MTIEGEKSPAIRRRSKHSTRNSDSSDGLSIEELFPDDMAYDADIEVVLPNHYEDADSASDSESASKMNVYTVDEELAERMRRLGSEHEISASSPRYTERGRKRTSRAFDDEDGVSSSHFSSELEVHEMVDSIGHPSPAKRRKKKDKRMDSMNSAFRNMADLWTGPSERADQHITDSHRGSSSPATASEQPARDEAEVMDMS